MVNEILSKELQVKPLTRGEVAVYKVLGAGEEIPNMVYDDGTHVRTSPRLGMVGESTIIDPFDQQRPNKTITHALSTRPLRLPDGTIQQEEVIERINFNDSGFLTIGFERMPTYYFLERCNENIDNPHRDLRRPALFGRVQANQRARKDLDIKYEEYEALSMVMEGNIDEIKLMASHLPEGMKIDLDNPIDSIKMDLIRVAEKDPRLLIMASSNKDAKRLIQFRDALKFQILVWDDKLREWYLNKPGGLQKICEVDIGVDKYERLLEVTKEKDNIRYYQQLVMLLGKVYKATVT